MSSAFSFGRSLVKVSNVCQVHKIKPWSWMMCRWFSGEGEGKGGGSGGSIKSAGGAFGKKEAAQEEQYFRKQQSRQLKDFKNAMVDNLKSKLSRYEQQRAAHMEGIKRHKDQLAKDGNKELHEFHIAQHEEAVKGAEEKITKIHETWKKMKLDN